MSASHRVRHWIEWLAMGLTASGCLTGSASGGVIFDASGTAASGRLVAVRATLAISGDGLTVDLENVSPANTTEASEVLTSFYFDIRKGASRPGLSFASAAGSVWLVRDGRTDVEYHYLPQTFTQASGLQSDLKAMKNGDASWQFRVMSATAIPLLGFGLGTVGNSKFASNGFTPSIVGPAGNSMLDFGIFRGGDLNPKGVLASRYLVKNRLTFRFTGLAGYDDSHIVGRAVFGLGSSPDSVLESVVVVVPEPATGLLTLTGVALAAAACRRRLPRRQPGSGRP